MGSRLLRDTVPNVHIPDSCHVNNASLKFHLLPRQTVSMDSAFLCCHVVNVRGTIVRQHALNTLLERF
jgi:hypothetical protein